MTISSCAAPILRPRLDHRRENSRDVAAREGGADGKNLHSAEDHYSHSIVLGGFELMS